MKQIPTREEFRKAEQILKEKGYEEVMSIMTDDKNTKDFGTLFSKGKENFWLNLHTINEVSR